MKKSFKLIACLLAAAVMAAPIAGCAEDKENTANKLGPVVKPPVTEVTPDNDTNYGELEIADAEVAVGEKKDLLPFFTRYLHKSAITYTFDGDDIEIDEQTNMITAKTAGKVIDVTAKTAKHETHFKVSTVQNHGINVADVISWEGYAPSEFTIRFDGAESEEVTYEYDSSNLTLNETKRTVIGKKVGTFPVKVTAGDKETTFNVTHKIVDKTGKNARKWDTSAHDEHVGNMRTKYANESSEDTVLFVGDSFFDVRWFWTDFYKTYAGKDAILAGSGGATTYDWEQYAHTFLKEAQPKNLVVTIGTNNIWDDQEDVATVYESLQRMFQVIHSELPDTKIYYFSIVMRSSDKNYHKKIRQINGQMNHQFCAGKDWITFIDVEGQIGLDKIQGDLIHPLLGTYSIYVKRLEEAGLRFAEFDASLIKDRPFTLSDNYSSSSSIIYKGAGLVRNYVLDGKADITAYSNNPHLMFRFNGNDTRFLLWGRDNASEFKIGWQCTGGGIDASPNDPFVKIPNETLTICWRIVVTNNDAYFYAGDSVEGLSLRCVITNLPDSTSELLIGSEGAAGRFYDISAKTLVDDKEEYDGILAELKDDIDEYSELTGFDGIFV